jgi:hypothetical protein
MTVKHFLINILPNRVFPRKKENEKSFSENGGTNGTNGTTLIQQGL